MKYVGIDYSMTSPAICLYDDSKPFSFGNCQHYYITDIKKYQGRITDNIEGLPMPSADYDIERYYKLAQATVGLFNEEKDIVLAVEDYAFGAKGRVFGIAENCGLMKFLVWSQMGKEMKLVAPSHIKKFATGKGAGKKELMYEAFIKDVGIDLMQVFGKQNCKLTNPITDIIDAYYLTKLLYTGK